MGDVFDAMRRAERERKNAPAAPAGVPTPANPVVAAAAPPAAPTGSDSEAPSLPIDQVIIPVDAGPVVEADSDALSSKPSAVRVAASARSEASATSQVPATLPPLIDAPLGVAQAYDPKLNGYSGEIVVYHDRGGLVTEQYRAIRTQILARARNRKLQVHVITSSAPEEGKSVTSLNLGMCFSELRSQRTVVVECDLRRPSFGKLIGRPEAKGLLQVLRGEAELDDVLQPTVFPNLQFIPAGGREPNESTQLLSSPRMVQTLERLRSRYHHIFVDTPPVVTVTDACILGPMADETLLVVRLNFTPGEVVERAKRLLRAANCDIAGMVLTHMRDHGSEYNYRYGAYYGSK